MSNFNLGKKLILPTKKTWKSFTNKLQSRLHKLKLSKAIKSSKNLCIRAYNYISPIITRKFYSLIHRSSSPLRTHRKFYHNYYQYQQCQKNTSPIYVDQLFPEPIVKQPACQNHNVKISAPQIEEFVASSSGGDVNCRNKLDQEEQEIIVKGIEVNSALKKGKTIIESTGINNYKKCDNINIIDEWRTPSMPHINGVDKRAEEFISKVREDMELERQQSILDFQEMLARGV
ncbi:hypothetical protein R3W88_025562 [Solanum pinnatisectum]|uniref:Uncharacterized protein n=1 Tax=Solanum pinnatisectum TaxID=50273 RepID=A0AAV9M6S3_9SOLN|nr:hypothetical protein R3W88_025562 [Solanum pinnatisectum]